MTLVDDCAVKTRIGASTGTGMEKKELLSTEECRTSPETPLLDSNVLENRSLYVTFHTIQSTSEMTIIYNSKVSLNRLIGIMGNEISIFKIRTPMPKLGRLEPGNVR